MAIKFSTYVIVASVFALAILVSSVLVVPLMPKQASSQQEPRQQPLLSDREKAEFLRNQSFSAFSEFRELQDNKTHSAQNETVRTPLADANNITSNLVAQIQQQDTTIAATISDILDNQSLINNITELFSELRSNADSVANLTSRIERVFDKLQSSSDSLQAAAKSLEAAADRLTLSASNITEAASAVEEALSASASAASRTNNATTAAATSSLNATVESSDFGGGSTGDDVLVGTAEDDSISGGSGNDVMYGNEGNDRLDGGSGNDIIAGWTGNDQISAGSENDIIYSDEGADSIDCGLGTDTVYGYNPSQGDTASANCENVYG